MTGIRRLMGSGLMIWFRVWQMDRQTKRTAERIPHLHTVVR